jgi:hypothetical protein
VGWLAGRRSEVRRLKQRLRGGDVVSIKQQDGTTFIVDRMEAFKATFMYLANSLRADADAAPRPEPPPVLVAVSNAKNRRDALERVLAGYNNLPVDPEALIEEGRFEPVSLVAGLTYSEVIERGGIPGLSEPGPEERDH